MGELHQKLAAERDHLRGVVTAIGDALSVFHDVANSRPNPASTRGTDTTAGIGYAKRRFAARLGEIFTVASANEPKSQEPDADNVVSDIRTNLLNLADQLVQLLYETAEKASLKKQLEVARAVQQMLVPSEDVIDRGGIRIAGYFEPAAECGGDWWTVHDMPEDRVLIVIGDVTGHGISSAMITGVAKAACDVARMFTKGRISAGALLDVMNSGIHEAAKHTLMMTCAASIYDIKTGVMTIANAGQTFPYLVRGNTLRQIIARGSPLGSAPTSEYQESTIKLEKGDAILWFTDGATECENDATEQFTEKRLRSLFQKSAAQRPEKIRDTIVDAISSFRAPRALQDDVTLVVAGIQ